MRNAARRGWPLTRLGYERSNQTRTLAYASGYHRNTPWRSFNLLCFRNRTGWKTCPTVTAATWTRLLMNWRCSIFAAVLLVGCSRAQEPADEPGPPPVVAKDFELLPAILAGIRDPASAVLCEGLPGSFWEPELQAQELKQKPTV